MNEMQRMRRARTRLIIGHPFFGYLSSKLILKESKLHPTLATDGRFLYFNPEFTRLLTENQTLTAVAHEVMHPACLHHERRGSRDPEKWNKAGDYAINLMLRDSKFEPINIKGVFNWLCDDKWRGMVAEQIYDRLPDDPQRHGCSILDGCEGEEGPDPGRSTQVNWKRALVEAVNYAKARGNVPKGVEELVDRVVRPRINWRRIIRNTLISCSRTDWTYARPNRRYAHLGIAMPVPFGYTSDAECWLDSSGSVSLPLFQQFLGAVVEIAKQLRVKIDVGVCDSEVQLFERDVRDTDVLKKIKFTGRGGTSFVPAFEHARKRRPRVLIYFTDLDGEFPTWRPSWQTLWVAPHGSSARASKVPFGRILELPKDLDESAA